MHRVLTTGVCRMAGTDTTATTTSYLCYALSQHPRVMRKLQAELDEVMPDARKIPDTHVLQSLPYLNAFISEGQWLLGRDGTH